MTTEARQLDFTFTFCRYRTYRAAVLAVVNESQVALSAKDIAALAGITYEQTIFALFALHNAEKIARIGRKSTAKWISLALSPPAESGFHLLENLFHAIVKR